MAELVIPYHCERQDPDNPRLRSYWIANHYCTDTYVGLRAYFFDDELACITIQKGRKCNEMFEWASVDMQHRVREYIISLDTDTFEATNDLIDMEEDLGTGYSITYAGQSLKKEVLLNGELVTIIKDRERDDDGKYNFHTITVRDKDGVDSDVDVRDILVPWYTK